MNKEKLILPISILLTGLILGGFCYAIQINKQKASEKQQVLEREAEAKKAEAERIAEEEKRQALIDFFNERASAIENRDYSKLYKLSEQRIKDNLTEEQYVLFIKKSDDVLSRKIIFDHLSIDGDKGIVYTKTVECLTEQCSEGDRVESLKHRKYVYDNGQWQLENEQPSERALAAATNYYIYSISKTEKRKNEFINSNAYGTNNKTFALQNFALACDMNREYLILIETSAEKARNLANSPVVNAQEPELPLYKPSYSTHCTSYKFGNSISTNCY